jgi:hypothetical protein
MTVAVVLANSVAVKPRKMRSDMHISEADPVKASDSFEEHIVQHQFVQHQR